MSDRVTVTRKDLEVTYYRGTGAGGQKRNKTSNCVRIHHRASGATVEATKSRKQGENQRAALKALSEHPKFLAWLQTQMARPSDFLVEKKIKSPDGKEFWVPVSDPRLLVTQEELNAW